MTEIADIFAREILDTPLVCGSGNPHPTEGSLFFDHPGGWPLIPGAV